MDSGAAVEAATGTSGGAIVAAALGCGYNNPSDLRQLLEDTKLKRSYWDLSWTFFSSLGLFRGSRLLKLLKRHFNRRLGDTDIPIKIIALELSDFTLEGNPSYTIFGTEETPDVMVYDAVRASMAIPFVFTPHEINGVRYVDGGVTAGFPLDIYGDGDDVVGLRMLSQGSIKAPRGWFAFFTYAKWVFESMMAAMDREHIDDAVHARTVYIRTEGPGLELTQTTASVDALWKVGYGAIELHGVREAL
jgi:predicted acylesterase/phospholipase RssA